MENAQTRGQPRALAAIGSMIGGAVPHAVLLVGPASSGKTCLAMDLAAGLLCSAPDPGARPCRNCRGCRLVASGNHPDLHRLAPQGAGGQVRIGNATNPEPGTIRRLIGDLALMPSEGGRRVAIVEGAHRINDDAQNALLKMLEEPPAGVTIVLCADDDECLLPTVRSRCARVRLGPIAGREIERWLGDLGVADAPSAARYARLAGGAPGLALAYARSPDAVRLRGEISRGLLDLLAASRHERLASVRSLTSSAAALEAALGEGRAAGGPPPAPASRGKKRLAAAAEPAAADAAATEPDGEDDAGADKSTAGSAAPKVSAAERRAAASSLLAIWASVARDLAVAAVGGQRRLRDPDLLDEMAAVAPTIAAGALVAFISQLGEVETQIDENVNPELALDVLALAWPRPGRVA